MLSRYRIDACSNVKDLPHSSANKHWKLKVHIKSFGNCFSCPNVLKIELGTWDNYSMWLRDNVLSPCYFVAIQYVLCYVNSILTPKQNFSVLFFARHRRTNTLSRCSVVEVLNRYCVTEALERCRVVVVAMLKTVACPTLDKNEARTF